MSPERQALPSLNFTPTASPRFTCVEHANGVKTLERCR
jgi:hypothetical protein